MGLRHIMACLAIGAFSTLAWADSDYLPKVEHAGKQCYYYKVGKGETVYGITKRFGWDEQIFMKLNPAAADLKGGQVVYYPCSNQTPAPKPQGHAQKPEQAKPARVDRSLSFDYRPEQKAAVPDAVKQAKPAEILKPAPADTLRAALQPIIYNVGDRETLASIVEANNTTATRILKDNPGLRPGHLEAGMRVRLYPGSIKENVQTRTLSEKREKGSATYKAVQGDDFASVARRFNITEEQLRAANPKLRELKKGKKLTVPLYEDVTVTKSVLVLDAREGTPTGLEEIYAEIHGLKAKGEPIDVTLVISTAPDDRRRDTEFLRGFLLGLESIKTKKYRVNLHVLEAKDNAELKKALASKTALTSDLLLTAFDKNIPAAVRDFAKTKGVNTVNVFDAKTDFSSLSPHGVQMLPPSDYFYDRASEYLTLVMPGRRFLFVGTDEGDAESMSAAVLGRLQDAPASSVIKLPDTQALADYKFNPALSYTIVSDAGSKDEVTAVLDVIDDVVERYPGLPLSLVGRPTWIVYAPALEKRFQKVDTYVPSRFVPAADSDAAKSYEALYRRHYESKPLSTLPAYGAMGYDAARYLIPVAAASGGDLNGAEQATDAVQLDFRLERPELWEGMLNKSVYLLHYTPFMTTDKIQL